MAGARHHSEESVPIQLNKADRVAMIKQLKRTNTTLIPAEVESMQAWALMFASHW
jgi:hypothetical protein